jgi:glycosyltransferase involved in cell wall biosynthesis
LTLRRCKGLGLLAMEAMAAGVAVIVPKSGSAPSFARDEENALILDPSDPTACYHAAVRLIEDPALRVRLGQQAVVHMVQFHPERAAANILNLLFPD